LIFRSGTVATAVLCCAQPAVAQDSPTIFDDENRPLIRDDVAGSRADPLPPAPLALGPFALRPSLAVGVNGDTNVFNAAERTDVDAYVTVAPAVTLNGDVGLARVAIDASGTVERFASTTLQNNERYAASGRVNLPIGSDIGIALGVFAARELEVRGQGGPIFEGLSAPLYDRLGGTFGVRAAAGPLRIEANGYVVRSQYLTLNGNGRQVDQSFRDTLAVGTRPRVEYVFGDRFGIFADAQLVYTITPPDAAIAPVAGGGARDATDITVRGGARWTDGIIALDLSGGWRRRDYRVATFADYAGFIFTGRAEWYPTELLSVRLTGGQQFRNSAIPAVPGILSHYAGLTIFYSPTPLLDIVVGGQFNLDRYRSIDPSRAGSGPLPVDPRLSSQNWTASAQGEYRFARNLAVTLALRYRTRSVSDPAQLRPYSGFSPALSVRVTL